MATRSKALNRLGKKQIEKAARNGGKPLHDGGGLYFVPKPPAGWWKFKYLRPKAYGGTETSLSFGQWPHVDLAYAREQRDEALKQLARGVDPSTTKKAEAEAVANSFEAVATQWLAAGCPGGKKNGNGVGEGTVTQLTRRLEKYVYPYIGNLPIRGVTVANARKVLERIEKGDKLVTAARVREVSDRVFRWAVGKDLADSNPFAALKGTIATARVKHFAAIVDARQFGTLLRAIDGYQGQPVTRAAMQMLALTFVRPSELRYSTWGEIDLEGDEPQWVVPEGRTKMRKPLVVPLCPRAVEILTELKKLTDRGPESWVFPSLRPQRPISENTVNAALRTLGYGTEQHVGHGFRSSASTLLHSLGHSPEVIETQLAHARPGVAGIYNRSHLLPQRRALMAAWGSYCDALKVDTGAKVTAIRA